jgi:hypothetical protein
MSRPCNVHHERSKSHYPERLARRGVSNSGVRQGDYIDCHVGEPVARTNPFHKFYKPPREGEHVHGS